MPQDTDAAPAATATPAAAAAAAIGSTPLSSGEDGVDLALPERPMLTTVDAFRGMLPERYKMPARNAMSACARAITVNLKASSLAPTRRGRYRIRMLQNLPSDTVAAAALGLPSAKCAPGLGGNDLCHSQPAEQCPSCTLAATAGAPAACAAPVEAGPGGRAPADAGSGSLPATGSGATTQASRSAALRMALEEVSDAGPGMQHAAHRSRTAASSPAPAPAAAVAGVAAGVEALAAMAGMGLCEMAPGAVTAELTSAIIAQQHALQEQQYQQAMSGTRSGHRSGSCTLAPDYQQGADDEPAVCHEVLAMCGRDAVTQEPVLIIAQYDVTTQLLAQLTGRTSPVRKVPFKFSALSTEPLNTNAPPSMRGSVNGVRVAGAPLGAGPAAAGAPAAADAASGVVPSLIPADEHTGFVPMGNRSYAESVSLTSVAQLSASGNQALVHSAQGSHASHAPTSSRSQRMRITRAPVSAVAEVEAAAGSTGGRIAAPDSATALQEAAAMLMDVLPDRALPQLNGTVSIAVPAAQQAAGGARVLQPGQPVSPPPPPQKQQQQQQQAAPAFSLALAGGGAVGVASGAVTRGPTTERLLANAAAEELLPEVLGEEHVVYAPNRSRRVVAPPGGLPGGTQAGGALADAGPMGGNRTAAWGSLMDPQCVPSARARRGRRLFGYAAGRDGAFDVLNQLEGDDSPLAMLHTDVPAPAYVADVDSSRPQMLYATAPPRLGQRQHGVSAASTPQGTTGAGESSATLQLSITAGGLCVGLVPTPVSSMHGAAAEPVTMTPAAVDSPAVAAAAALAASAVAGANGGRESPRFAGGHAAGAPLPPVEEATTTGTGTASSSNTRDQQLSTQQASGGIAEAPVENTAGTDVVGWPESSVASGASHGAGMALLRLMAPLHAHGFADAPPPRSRS
ncbi:hypothetical protein HYH02_007682 [Chlamydomonas schloesseri]|uniref:Uncharacterized protein n=1 Tax=Chlamydomonas schloesseri TaxID=2026947 RepID=A0A836B4Q3_9CHLO|nr:hypothetical protein HYH02_007682 [Chlamydomonas schloesseri]|eukprot:KAG2447353.1 hypothetical protein HYH02_007682 [Chlamydomonas schloesseri]